RRARRCSRRARARRAGDESVRTGRPGSAASPHPPSQYLRRFALESPREDISMLRKLTALVLVVSFFAVGAAFAQGRGGGGQAAPAGRTPSIEERTAGLQKIDGFFPLYWDDRAGTLWLEIPALEQDFLLATGLSAGLGSNDIGLDRGQEGGGRVVSFHRI